MKVAIVHDYLNQFGGAERVVCELAKIFTDAPIYTSIYYPDHTWPDLKHSKVVTSWLQQLPIDRRYFKALLPLYPLTFAQMRIRGFDVVISSSSSFAKGISVDPDTIHICYCHTPTRFLWSVEDYLGRPRLGPLAQQLLQPMLKSLRQWDLEAARKPDYFIANSSIVKQRIARVYGREARVIHPSVNVHRFKVSSCSEDFYLIVSRLLSYKRIDVAVEAFNRLGLPLVIIGDGPDRAYLQRLADSHITFTGYLPDDQVKDYFGRCRAFIFPGEEDFGIAPLEANACGKPVIAYRAGGALDTVVEEQSGLFFDEPAAEALMASVLRSRQIQWDPQLIRRHSEVFCPENFKRSMVEFIREVSSSRRVHTVG